MVQLSNNELHIINREMYKTTHLFRELRVSWYTFLYTRQVGLIDLQLCHGCS